MGDEIKLRENEMGNLRDQLANEKDPIKRAELARQMAAKEQEIEMLRKQQQLAADQEKNVDNLLIKQNELDDLRTRFENEKDPDKKAELARLMAGKSRELEELKKQAQLTAE